MFFFSNVVNTFGNWYCFKLFSCAEINGYNGNTEDDVDMRVRLKILKVGLLKEGYCSALGCKVT